MNDSESNKSNFNLSSSGTTNFYASYGHAHNQALRLQRKEMLPHDSLTHFQYDTVVNNKNYVKYSLLEEFYANIDSLALLELTQSEYDEYQDSIKEFYNRHGLIQSFGGVEYVESLIGNGQTILNDNFSLGLMDTSTYNKLSDLMNYADNRNETEILNWANSIDTNTYDLTDDSLLFATKSIIDSSYAYWSGVYDNCNTGSSTKIKNPNTLKDFDLGTAVAGWVGDIIGAMVVTATAVPVAGASLVGAQVVIGGASIMAAALYELIPEPNQCVCPVCEYYNIEN